MGITDEIARLRDESLSSLNASHNYFFHTEAAWRLVQDMVREGRKITIRNQATGDTVNETELSGLAHDYVAGHLASATFQSFVSLFEQFMFDFFRVWLTEHPDSLSEKQLDFKTVLDATDKSEIVAAVVQQKVHKITHNQPVVVWFAYLEKIAQLGCPKKEQIERLIEIKASRNVLVHKNGIVDSIYVDKSMERARFAEGDVLELPEDYHRTSWQLMKQIVTDVADAGINKLRN